MLVVAGVAAAALVAWLHVLPVLRGLALVLQATYPRPRAPQPLATMQGLAGVELRLVQLVPLCPGLLSLPLQLVLELSRPNELLVLLVPPPLLSLSQVGVLVVALLLPAASQEPPLRLAVAPWQLPPFLLQTLECLELVSQPLPHAPLMAVQQAAQ